MLSKGAREDFPPAPLKTQGESCTVSPRMRELKSHGATFEFWDTAGLHDVQGRDVEMQRSFVDFLMNLPELHCVVLCVPINIKHTPEFMETIRYFLRLFAPVTRAGGLFVLFTWLDTQTTKRANREEGKLSRYLEDRITELKQLIDIEYAKDPKQWDHVPFSISQSALMGMIDVDDVEDTTQNFIRFEEGEEVAMSPELQSLISRERLLEFVLQCDGVPMSGPVPLPPRLECLRKEEYDVLAAQIDELERTLKDAELTIEAEIVKRINELGSRIEGSKKRISKLNENKSVAEGTHRTESHYLSGEWIMHAGRYSKQKVTGVPDGLTKYHVNKKKHNAEFDNEKLEGSQHIFDVVPDWFTFKSNEKEKGKGGRWWTSLSLQWKGVNDPTTSDYRQSLSNSLSEEEKALQRHEKDYTGAESDLNDAAKVKAATRLRVNELSAHRDVASQNMFQIKELAAVQKRLRLFELNLKK